MEDNYLFSDRNELADALPENFNGGNYPNVPNDFNTFGNDYNYGTISLTPNLNIATDNNIKFFFSVNFSAWYYINEDNTNPFTIDLYHAYFYNKQNKVSVEAGFIPFIVAGGFVLYNNEPGVDIQYRIAPHYFINFRTAIIFNDSPFISIDFEYRHSLFEKLVIFGSYLKDKDSKVLEMTQNHVLINQVITSTDGNYLYWLINRPFFDATTDDSSNLFWLGLSANGFIGPLYFTGTSVFQLGTTSVLTNEETLTVKEQDISAYLIDVEVNYKITDTISIGTFLFVSSGDIEPAEGRITEFFAPMPYHTRAPVFFEGFGTIDEEDTLSLMGVFKLGAFAPGIKLVFTLNEDIFIKLSLTGIYPEKIPSDENINSYNYGWESDLIISYNIKKNWQIFMEAGHFTYGNYFETTNGRPDPATRMSVQFFATF